MYDVRTILSNTNDSKIFDFFLHYFEGYPYNKTRSNLWKKVGDKYTQVANKFLGLMANASTEVWKCDPEGGYDGNMSPKSLIILF